eukprot:353102-Chlamydomonas_euryale.AAC.4
MGKRRRRAAASNGIAANGGAGGGAASSADAALTWLSSFRQVSKWCAGAPTAPCATEALYISADVQMHVRKRMHGVP